MKLNIKINESEDILSLTVPDNATVEDLKISIIVSLPASTKITSKNMSLWYSGLKLDYSKSLSSYNITPNSILNNSNMLIYLTNKDDVNIPISNTLNVSKNIDSAILSDSDDHELLVHHKKSKSRSRSKSRTKSKSKSKKCSFPDCTSAPLRMVGDCQFCHGKFCSKHRLLESHNCKDLKICKDKCYERNALKLQSEQTVASKV